MAASRRGGLVWLLCYAGLSFSGFAAAEARLPLPEIRVDRGVRTEEYDKVKAQKAALEEKVKEIEEKLQEAEQRANKAEQALAERNSESLPSAPVEVSQQPFEPVMVYIEGGRFLMGCLSGKGCEDNEKIHPVTVDSFYMGQTEVTVSQYIACIEAKGCGKPDWLEDATVYLYLKKAGDTLGGGGHPIVGVSWNDARDYVKWLSKQTDKDYGLSTEAQWEYAARAGTVPVKSFEPHKGLYNIAGNVFEWTCSAYEEDYSEEETQCANENDSRPRVIRGGSWRLGPWFPRPVIRYGLDATKRNRDIRFRVSRIR